MLPIKTDLEGGFVDILKQDARYVCVCVWEATRVLYKSTKSQGNCCRNDVQCSRDSYTTASLSAVHFRADWKEKSSELGTMAQKSLMEK